MKKLPPKLREKYRRLLNFSLTPEFAKLSDDAGRTIMDPLAKKKKGSASKSRQHHGIWCIDTPEGILLLDATFSELPNGKLRYRSHWSFVASSQL
jgi:hypothetical protein